MPGTARGASSCCSISLLLPSLDRFHATQSYLVKTPPARPNLVLLALSTTSSSVSNGRMDMTGPKISSFTHVMSSVQFPGSVAEHMCFRRKSQQNSPCVRQPTQPSRQHSALCSPTSLASRGASPLLHLKAAKALTARAPSDPPAAEISLDAVPRCPGSL